MNFWAAAETSFFFLTAFSTFGVGVFAFAAFAAGVFGFAGVFPGVAYMALLLDRSMEALADRIEGLLKVTAARAGVFAGVAAFFAADLCLAASLASSLFCALSFSFSAF